MNKPILIFGDSHTRSYTGTPGIYPFFIGPGKVINLNNHQHIISLLKPFFIKNTTLLKGCIVCFQFGEPNCRFLINSQWDIFQKYNIIDWKHIPINTSKIEHLNTLICNYDELINELKPYMDEFYIITPTTAFFPTYNFLTPFNKLLNKHYKNIVIDLYKHTFHNINIYNTTKYNSIIVDKIYQNNDLIYDPIHLNKNILNLLIHNTKWKPIPITKCKFKINARFGSYLLD